MAPSLQPLKGEGFVGVTTGGLEQRQVTPERDFVTSLKLLHVYNLDSK